MSEPRIHGPGLAEAVEVASRALGVPAERLKYVILSPLAWGPRDRGHARPHRGAGRGLPYQGRRPSRQAAGWRRAGHPRVVPPAAFGRAGACPPWARPFPGGGGRRGPGRGAGRGRGCLDRAPGGGGVEPPPRRGGRSWRPSSTSCSGWRPGRAPGLGWWCPARAIGTSGTRPCAPRPALWPRP
jgi:hypothetical protein